MYRLQSKQFQDSLRRRFGNALNWYYGLRDATKEFVDKVVEATRNVHHGIAQPSAIPDPPQDGDLSESESSEHENSAKRARSPSPASGMEDEEETVPRESQQRRKRKRTGQHGNTEYPFPEPPLRDRPSQYLRARCPLCFGGKNLDKTSLHPHSLVSIDACFQQKHNKQVRDPPRQHPDSYFVNEDIVSTMEEYVNGIRPPRPAKQKAAPSLNADEDDQYEHAELKVSRSVLNSCNDSFIAADEAREKASTQFFDVTGLMALICRHDRVLWIVNMTSAGEKQHYVFVLLEMLFQNVPHWWTFGILYDIACQTHRTCLKWGFMDRYLSRIVFAISVFHAYGHGWACQLIYHPRKCRCFGWTDGEGCERCWKAIRFLIAYLRVCGVRELSVDLCYSFLAVPFANIHFGCRNPSPYG